MARGGARAGKSRGRRGAIAALSGVAAATFATIGLATSSGTGAAAVSHTAATSRGCPPLVLFFSRGSGQDIFVDGEGHETLGLANPGLPLLTALRDAYGASNVASVANAYPAIPVPLLPKRYSQSVARGVEVGERNLKDLISLCPTSSFVLGGYSQGAQVSHELATQLSEAEATHIAAVLLFGDPQFAVGEPGVEAVASPPSLPAFNPKRRGVAFNRLLSIPPPRPIVAGLAGRVFSWCHGHDPVCQGAELLHPFRQTKGKTHFNYSLDVGVATATIAGTLRADGLYPLESGMPVDRYRVANTCDAGTCAVAEWSLPARTHARLVGAFHEHQQLRIICQVRTGGEPVADANGGTSDIWDRLADGGFVPDLYTSTPGPGKPTVTIQACREAPAF
jgi:Cutinase